jgi:hypothetical protein
VPVLAKNDITKYEQVRKSTFVEAVLTLELFINSI